MTRLSAFAVSVQSDGVRAPVAAMKLHTLVLDTLRALRVPAAMLSITMVSARRMATLNRTHLGHRGATDVITFSLTPGADRAIVADIYICPDVARDQAIAHRVGVREELARLVIHGTLHACGWDHPVDEGREGSRMWRRQEQLLRRLWISPNARA
jgi:probable rRNA maturation factor